LSLILPMFPENVLHRFWYVSVRLCRESSLNVSSYISKGLLPLSILDHLYSQQRTIRKFQITPSDEFPFLSFGAHDLDVCATDSPGAAKYIQKLVASAHSVRRLHLTASDYEIQLLLPDSPRSSGRMPPLEELSLSRFDLQGLFQPLSVQYDLSALTHLTLLKCVGVLQFLAALRAASQRAPLQLTHIAVDLFMNDVEAATGAYDADLASVIEACKVVRSIHVHWPNDDSEPRLVMEQMIVSGQSLELLSLSNCHRGHALDPQSFDRVVSACPYLRQLAVQIDEEMLLYAMGFLNHGHYLVSHLADSTVNHN